ncbi:MAG TPA: lamin tail domain-containing protein, partial [Chloroflexia bacterium]|nr:lamin tail domain-containing protein [Chloroflexia bacterium]
VVATFAGLLAAVQLTARPALAVSDGVVISQVYGGGGNSGATYTNDFIELFNRGSVPVDMTGWSVQYASTMGSSWSKTSLSGSLAPGQYYLIQEAQGAGGTIPLPTPDITGTIAMAATAGKVALVTNATTLTGTCPTGAVIVDFVGYGSTTNCFEGTGPAPGLSNTTADSRNATGTDTDNNSADFAAGAPNPRNSGSGGGPTNTPTSTPTPVPPVHIHDIQGAAHLSPSTGQQVNILPSIVTAKVSNGFYLQDPNPDSDDATSEGVFVFTNSAPTVNVGDQVTVRGRVSEFRPGGSSGTNLTTTEIGSPIITLVSSGNALPTPVVIGAGGRTPPTTVIEDDANGSVETSGTFDPDEDGIDFYESLEGMRVQINDAVASGPTSDFSSNREIPVLVDSGANASVRTTRGGIIIRPTDFNPERIILNDLIDGGPNLPLVNVADRFPGATIGVMDYNFGNFKLQVTDLPALVAGGLAREVAAPVTDPNKISFGAFNVENLDPGDPQTKFDTLAGLIVNNLRSPDILSIEEIQDNNGATDNGVVNADVTWQKLIDAVAAAGGPTYQYRQINPVNDQDGGEPGGNIRVGFLFRTDRGVSFIDRPGGTSTAAVSVVDGADGPELSFSPGRIDPTNDAFNSSRKPLAGEFLFHGQKLFVIANHFNSKGGDDPLFGRFQPPQRSSEIQRHAQAQIVHDFVASILLKDPAANIVVDGDLNDFEFSDTLNMLKDGNVLYDLIETLPQAERYTYVFEGNSQAIDHILVSPQIYNNVPFTEDVVHVNSEFADQASDHEPQVARFTLPALVNTARIVASTATCSQYAAGGATVVGEALYKLKQQRINSVAPGAFSYFTQFTTYAAGSFTVRVLQSNDQSGVPLFDVQNSVPAHVTLYNADCTVSALPRSLTVQNGQVSLTVNGAGANQQFILGVMYRTDSVVGSPPPNPATVHYDFLTTLHNIPVNRDLDGLDLRQR